ncbi:MAG: nuclear transport factor 2 family protein [Nannocystales bacterium]
MKLPIRPESARILEDYLRAKDAQVPHLYRRVFTADARFVATYAMPSPFGDDAPRQGFSAIVDGFRTMGTACENILTVVPIETLDETAERLLSRWVVAMTKRDGSGAFVGWGTYRWRFDATRTRARELAVRFEGLHEPADEDATFDAMLDLSHPWCSLQDVQEFARRIGADALAEG